jgi:hypothetical protein
MEGVAPMSFMKIDVDARSKEVTVDWDVGGFGYHYDFKCFGNKGGGAKASCLNNGN